MSDRLSVAPEERRSVAMLFLHGFGTAAAYVLSRTVADSAFLSHVGPQRLPEMYMLAAGVVALSSLGYGRLLAVQPHRRLVMLSLLGLGAVSAALPALMAAFPQSLTVFAVVYLLAQLRGSLGTIQFATLVTDQFGDRQPERVVGLVGAGATLAGILMGLTIGAMAERVDVGSLFYLAAAIDLLTMLPVAALPRRRRPTPTVESPGVRMRDAWEMPYVAAIAGVVGVSVMAATLVEFQWKVTASETLMRDEEDLARYFGYFYGGVYLATGLLQLLATSRVLQSYGTLAGLLAFPVALLISASITWAVTAQRMLLWPVTLSKSCDTLKRSLSDPSIQVLYSPLETGLRKQTITLVAGIAKPLAEAVAAVSLVALTPWLSVRQLSLVVVLLTVVWISLSVRAWRRFRVLRAKVDSSAGRGSGEENV